ncbi:MAG: hypothetical protein OMM_15306, partial [Candidatus Magnetoglobus multicellularis str. Araruama]
MIDNYEKAMELLEKMKSYLPIPVTPTKDTLNNIRQNNIKVSKEYKFQIESVLYMGDMGGIGCAISTPEAMESALVVSITHLKIHAGHPLAKEIKSYQKKRTKKLA